MQIRISLPQQMLELHDSTGLLLQRYLVSTAKNGAGEQSGSYCTPRGWHIIRAKISGEPRSAATEGSVSTTTRCVENTVFVRRRPTGEIWSPELAAQFPNRDWILTRILWLSGTEPGKNRLGTVDTMRRYIYLHGSPDTVAMGTPGSIGCIRMRNKDIIELFDQIPIYTPVNIVEFGLTTGTWEELGTLARPLREAVFVVEQGVPLALEWDEFDAISRHVVARDHTGRVIGTGRLLPDGHIGRIAVAADWRGKDVGRALMERLIEEAIQQQHKILLLHAQTCAVGFYAKLGFVAEGPEFMEAGIPHRQMRRYLISA
jgi:predicted GNAT family N-acyltransferase